MHTTEEQLSSYNENGFVLLSQCFSDAEIARLKEPLPKIFAEETPRKILEKDGVTVRSVFGSHQTHSLFGSLTRDARISEPARQIVGMDVYVHQFKINAKARFSGDAWPWHQDFIYWRNEDGIPLPELTTAVLFLDEVNEFNGPMLFVPASHKYGTVEIREAVCEPAAYVNAPGWIGDLIADLKYPLDHETTTRLAGHQGILAPKGPPGSLLFFHPNVFHASCPNLSPFDRSLILITYNSISNKPTHVKNRRPAFLCSQDYTAV